MIQESLRFYEFGPFRLSVGDRLLERGNELVPLTPKVFDTLLLLVEHRGRVLDKNALMESLWPDTFVEESSLAQNISLLRKALGDLGAEHQYVETIPKRGYRFVARVHEVDGPVSEMTLQERISTEILFEEEIESEPNGHRSTRRPALIFTDLLRRRGRFALTIGVVAAVALTATVIARLWYQKRPTNQISAVRSIAVLPFRTIGSESNQDLLGVGMANAVILKLGGTNQAIVLPTSSVMKYTSGDRDTLSIGKDIGVDAILDGTLQRDGDEVRVTAQLIRTSDGKTIWSDEFDQRYDNTFAFQDSVSNLLSRALIEQIAGKGKYQTVRHPTEDEEANRLYLTGLYFWNRRNKENLSKAIPYFEQAIKQDPKFALAHALLADCYYLNIDGKLGIIPDDQALTRLRAETASALEFDSDLAEAHTVRAGLALLESDAETASREFRRALELNPNYPVAHLRYGYFLFSLQRLHEANDQMALAQQLDPVSPTTNTARGYMLFISRDYDSAINSFKKALELQPDFPIARFNLGGAYVSKGMFQEAMAEFEKLKDSEPLMSTMGLAYAQGLEGQVEAARRTLSNLQSMKGHEAIDAYEYVVLQAAVGEKEKAFASLEKVKLKSFCMAKLKFDPQLDSLRGDVRFAQYLSRHQNEMLPLQLSS